MLDAGLTPRRRALFILLLGVTAYAPVLRLPFLWDDHTMIESNAHLRQWNRAELRHDFTTDVFDGHGDRYYRPAQTLANRIDFTVWKLHPFGYHLTNLAAHLANALLLQALVLMLGFSPLEAFLCASLFVVHPIGVEQLMIVAGRAELMGLTFTLLSLIFLLRADALSWLVAVLCFMIALLFKESSVVVPALAALLFAWNKKPLKEHLRPASLLVLIPPYLWLRAHAVGPLLTGLEPGLVRLFMVKALPAVLFKYTLLVLWPWNLHSHRLMAHIQMGWWWQWIVFAVAIAVMLFWPRGRLRLGWLALGWFFLSLAPKIPIMIMGDFMLDHWAYPASIGVFLLLSVFFAYGWTHSRPRWVRALSSAYFVLVIAYSLLVRLNIELRGTDEKMYRWALYFTTSNPIRHNLGLYLVEHGRPEEAIPYLDAVRHDYPDDRDNNYELAKAYYMAGHRKIAAALLKSILARHPNDALTRQTLNSLRAR